MASILRTIVFALAALGLGSLWSPSALASEITYIFQFVVTDVSQGPPGGTVNVGDTGTMAFRVNAATAPDPAHSNSTMSVYPGAVVGGGVTIGAQEWTFGGPGYDLGGGPNYAMIGNDHPSFDGGPVTDLLFLKGPLTGLPVSGFPPVSFSAFLWATRPAPNDALTGLSFPTALDLAQFDSAEASFGYLDTQPGGRIGNYLLDIEAIRVIPEPATWLLFALAMTAAMRLARRKAR